MSIDSPTTRKNVIDTVVTDNHLLFRIDGGGIVLLDSAAAINYGLIANDSELESLRDVYHNGAGLQIALSGIQRDAVHQNKAVLFLSEFKELESSYKDLTGGNILGWVKQEVESLVASQSKKSDRWLKRDQFYALVDKCDKFLYQFHKNLARRYNGVYPDHAIYEQNGSVKIDHSVHFANAFIKLIFAWLNEIADYVNYNILPDNAKDPLGVVMPKLRDSSNDVLGSVKDQDKYYDEYSQQPNQVITKIVRIAVSHGEYVRKGTLEISQIRALK